MSAQAPGLVLRAQQGVYLVAIAQEAAGEIGAHEAAGAGDEAALHECDRLKALSHDGSRVVEERRDRGGRAGGPLRSAPLVSSAAVARLASGVGVRMVPQG